MVSGMNREPKEKTARMEVDPRGVDKREEVHNKVSFNICTIGINLTRVQAKFEAVHDRIYGQGPGLTGKNCFL